MVAVTRLVPGIVSSVTDMDGMFREATSFNRPIETWNVGECYFYVKYV